MANLYGPRIVTDGLRYHLDAANRKSYPGSGSTWYNLADPTNSSNFTLNGNLTYTDSGTPGNFYFDAFNDTNYVSGPSYSHRLNGYTYSFWLKYDATSTYNTLFENGYWPDALLYRHQTNTSSVRVYAEGVTTGDHTVAGNALVLGSATYPLSKWYNFVFTRATTVNYPCKMYIDGNSYSGFNMTGVDINLSNYNLYLMRSQHASSQFTDGKLSVFQMYTRTLSANEVQQNYNALKGRYGL